MADRIDHAAQARKLIENARINSRRDVTVEAAQVHATLALVEQQRIANVIALSQATNADGSRIAPWALTHPVDDWSVALNDDIREGMGL